MNSRTVLVTGVITGLATLYAHKNGYTVDYVITKIEDNNEEFGAIIRKLYNLAIEVLTKLLDIITKFVEELIFKTKLKFDDLKLSKELK